MDKNNNNQIKLVGDLLNDYLKTRETMANYVNLVISSSAFESLKKEVDRINNVVKNIQLPVNFNSLNSIVEQQKLLLKKREEILSSISVPKLLPVILQSSRSPLIITSKKTEQIGEEGIKKLIESVVEELLDKRREKLFGILKNKFPYQLPPDTKWEEITIKFRDRHNITIIFKKIMHNTNYAEMGFNDKRKLKPNLQWILLENLSKTNGQICWTDENANMVIKKKKQLLVNSLKKYFCLDTDPFYPYSKREGYRIKINLISEKESINKIGDTDQVDEKYDDLDDFYKSSASTSWS
ncbi:MAG: hypothetical protein PHT51_04045 [Patescibacteria group bacterium]|nr:hypothetical protein [Patescibacteria group bacterium]MDD4610466.1 hypothetical protein [Patescibacteria group bacterium]